MSFALVAAGLAGCATDPTAIPPGPAYNREIQEGRPGLFGDLRWTIDTSSGQRTTGHGAPLSAAEQEAFKKWRDSNPNDAERREFEEWRAWQEWKRRNPK